jgi:hypothetical protein
MPCLAEYDDGLWYRAKIVSIKEFNPLAVLVQFVDYGSTEKLTVNRLKNKKVNLVYFFLIIKNILLQKAILELLLGVCFYSKSYSLLW